MRTFNYLTAMAMTLLTTLTLGSLGCTSVPADQKDNAAAQNGWPVRLADGQPDVQGIWKAAGPGGGSGMNVETLTNWNNTGRTFQTSLVDPPDHILPYHPWARALRDEVSAEHLNPTPALVDPRTRAWPDGVPRITYYNVNAFQILQSPGLVALYYEAQHEFRIIPIDGRAHPGEAIKLWMGDSRGRWEGTTLVLDVANNNDRARFSVVGDFHSDQMHVTERLKFVDANTIELTSTIDDPMVFTRPWTMSQIIKRVTEDGFRIMEYAGVEGEKLAEMFVDKPGTGGAQP